MNGQTTWTLGILIGLPLVAVVIVAVLVIGAWIEEFAKAIGIVIVLLVATAFCTFPWAPRYHQYRVVSGPVQDVGSRFIAASGGGSDQKFAVTINDAQWGCEDTRCSTVHKGDVLTLGCKAVWQYAAADGWDCRFIGVKKAAA